MISGIINLKKEAGMTSHDAVFKLRKILHEKKIGNGSEGFFRYGKTQIGFNATIFC